MSALPALVGLEMVTFAMEASRDTPLEVEDVEEGLPEPFFFFFGLMEGTRGEESALKPGKEEHFCI